MFLPLTSLPACEARGGCTAYAVIFTARKGVLLAPDMLGMLLCLYSDLGVRDRGEGGKEWKGAKGRKRGGIEDVREKRYGKKNTYKEVM